MNKTKLTYLIPQRTNRKSFGNKAIVREEQDSYVLMSYMIDVFEIPKDENIPMRLLWNGYSHTTYSHIKEFIIQYGIGKQVEDLSTKITKKEIESFL